MREILKTANKQDLERRNKGKCIENRNVTAAARMEMKVEKITLYRNEKMEGRNKGDKI